MPLSNTTEHTPLNLCVIVEKWLADEGYTKLHIMHTDVYRTKKEAYCLIYAEDMARNRIEIGYISPEDVLLLNGDEYDIQRLKAYDVRFFEKLTGCLSFAKP